MSQENTDIKTADEVNASIDTSKDVLNVTNDSASPAVNTSADSSLTSKTVDAEKSSTATSNEPLKIIHAGWLSKLPQSGTASLNGIRYQARYFVLTNEVFGYAAKRLQSIALKDLNQSWDIKDVLYADLDGKDHLKILINSGEAEKRTLIAKGAAKSVELWLATLRTVGVQPIPAEPPITTTTTSSADTTAPVITTENAEAKTSTTDETQKKASINPLQKAANWFSSSLKLGSKAKEQAPASAQNLAAENPTTENSTEPSAEQSAKNDSEGDQHALANEPTTEVIPDWPMATPVERDEPRESRCAGFFNFFSFCSKESD